MSKARQLADLGNVYDDGALSNRNLIINSHFSVWQRGTTFSQDTLNANNIYTADRWNFARNGNDKNCTVTQVTGDSSQYAIKVQRDSGDTNDGVISISQFLETANVIKLRGKNLVAKVRLKVGSDYTGGDITIMFSTTSASESSFTKNSAGNIASDNADYDSNSVDITPTTSFADYTVDLGSVASTANVASIRIVYTNVTTGTAGSDDSFTVDAVQLEVGDTATPFEHRSYGDELARCQRYYEVGKLKTVAGVKTFSSATTNDTAGWDWRVVKRATPTVTIYSGIGTADKISYYNSQATEYDVSFVNGADVNGVAAVVTTTNFERDVYFSWVAEAEL